jgi:hypothetical protein
MQNENNLFSVFPFKKKQNRISKKLWDNFERYHLCAIGIPDREEKYIEYIKIYLK